MAPAPTLPPEALERNHILQQILDRVEDYAPEFDLVDYHALKDQVLRPVLSKEFNPEVQIRGFLKAFRHTLAYKSAFSKIQSDDLKQKIEEFSEGKRADEVMDGSELDLVALKSPPVQHHFSLMQQLKRLLICGVDLKAVVTDVFHPKHKHVKNLPILYEDVKEEKVIECYSDVPFENWGQTVKNSPKYTFLPTTVRGVQNIVLFANWNNYRVRCGGYRHSWSSIFSQDNEIFISFVNLDVVTTLPDPMSILPGEYDPSTVPELKTIELLKETVPGKKRLCRIGTAVTNEEFRRWAVAGKSWTFPADVILVEVTIGGVNGPICHGAGITHKTLSDYVRRIEYVDCNGNCQMVDDPEHLKAAAGAFGLMGVITHLTFELDAMTYAVIKPLKEDVGLGVPPLSKHDIPPALRSSWFHTREAESLLERATSEFRHRAEHDYYSEWFWFTYQKKVWTNTFNVTTDPTNAITYPDDGNVFLQWIQGWLGGVITEVPFFNAIPGYWQAQLIASLGMAALPPTLGEKDKPEYKTLLPDALHFRRGVQNMRVRDLELQIPLPPRADDARKPDWSLVQRAWWGVVNLVYADAETGKDPSSAMRLALEMRIMSNSDLYLAPQRGNDLGTLSIEVLTLPDAVTDDEWQGFAQRVVDLWVGLGGNVRPHWAKEWERFEFRGMESRRYMKEVAFKEEIPMFRDVLERIGEKHGWTLEQVRKRFSNQLWDVLVFE
ncbi:hypothetical protein M011DRAFT_67900 [Sporormia fimetaria CBS 119925]|uniref:FAD-binding PCMH-type domain-containing protein n=1 Tax=Sporormia fimetaria CBS 119925 TaxID=1340428 RepID=A0A6A6VBC2_9PLEO|nr:hypothetical protein M011DRAFT_67900 [Sporormia fimetaria CBS 119925]